MNHRARAAMSRIHQAGLTMIELMIGLVISLIMLAAIGYVFISSQQAFRSNDGLSRLQENTRAAVLMINTTIRSAGFIASPLAIPDPTKLFVYPRLPIFGDKASSLITSPYAITPYGIDNQCQVSCDYLAVSFQGAADNSTRDCQGSAVSAGTVVTNVFFISKSTSDDPGGPTSLYCWVGYYNVNSHIFTSASQQPLVYGITRFTVLYGIDQDNNQAVDYYASATQLGDPSNPAWNQVRSVQITLAVESPDTINAADTHNAAATRADSTTTRPRLERTLTQIVAIRNRITP